MQNTSPCEFVHVQNRSQEPNLNYYGTPWTNPHSYFWGTPYFYGSEPETWWDDSFTKEPEPNHKVLYKGQPLMADKKKHTQKYYTPNELVSCNTCLNFHQESSVMDDVNEILTVAGVITILIILLIIFI